MLAGISRLGAERAFIRLDAASPLTRIARDAGFFPYQPQVLLQRNGKPGAAATEVAWRVRDKQDLHGIFQLYLHAVPANVRAIEGVTFKEWQAALEPWGGRITDLVLEEDGAITAWARTMAGHAGRLVILSNSRSVSYDDLIDSATSRLAKCDRILSLVPEQDVGLAAAFERAGFVPAGNYTLMAKRLVRTAEELAPEPATTAIPVN
jgi:hypothetical protein